METITLNLENLNKEERETLMGLVEKANKSDKPWKPKLYDEYYYLAGDGTVRSRPYQDTQNDRNYMLMGNYYKTAEAAADAGRRIMVIHELEAFAAERNKGKINWEDTSRPKYYIYYDYNGKSVSIDFVNIFKFNSVFFTSEKLARQAIEKIGLKRIKKYYLGVDTEG